MISITSVVPSLELNLEKVKDWMTARGRAIDLGRWTQVGLLLIAIASIIFEAGRIIDRQDTNKEAILTVIKANEEKRDLKDNNKEKDINDLRVSLADEIRKREKVEEQSNRLERLLLVQFGHAAEVDPLKKEK